MDIQKILNDALEPIVHEVITLENTIKALPSIPSITDVQISIMENEAFIKSITPAPIEVDIEEVTKALKEDEEFITTIKGDKGEAGVDGVAGSAGIDGVNGVDGIDGVTSVLLEKDIQVWSEGITHKGTVVQHHIGRVYLALQNTTDEPSSKGDWKRLGSTGLRFTGGYDKDYEYEVGDIYVDEFSTFMFTGKKAVLIAARQKEIPAGDVAKSVIAKSEFYDKLSPLIKKQVDEVVIKKANELIDKRYSWIEDDEGNTAIYDNVLRKAISNAPHPILKDVVENMKAEGEKITIPVNSYRGVLVLGVQYSRGDVVAYNQMLMVCHTSGTLNSSNEISTVFNVMMSAQSAGGYGSTFGTPIVLDYDDGQGTISIEDDPYQGGKAMEISSPDGVAIVAPYIVLVSQNLLLTVAGAFVGSRLVVAGIDASGASIIGFENPPPPSYAVTAENPNPVVIKATNAPISATWVDMGTTLILGQDVAANVANYGFGMILSNNTTRTGTVEFAARINGVVSTRTAFVQIAANYLQTFTMNIPLQNAYSTGDVIELVSRVTVVSNVQFDLRTTATALNPSTAKLYTI